MCIKIENHLTVIWKLFFHTTYEQCHYTINTEHDNTLSDWKTFSQLLRSEWRIKLWSSSQSDYRPWLFFWSIPYPQFLSLRLLLTSLLFSTEYTRISLSQSSCNSSHNLISGHWKGWQYRYWYCIEPDRSRVDRWRAELKGGSGFRRWRLVLVGRRWEEAIRKFNSYPFS